jgi:hypothetical protein
VGSYPNAEIRKGMKEAERRGLNIDPHRGDPAAMTTFLEAHGVLPAYSYARARSDMAGGFPLSDDWAAAYDADCVRFGEPWVIPSRAVLDQYRSAFEAGWKPHAWALRFGYLWHPAYVGELLAARGEVGAVLPVSPAEVARRRRDAAERESA